MRHLIRHSPIRQKGTIDSRLLLRFALIAIVVGILALTGLQYLNRQQKAKLSQQLGAHGTDSSFALSVAKTQQQEALAELRKATNLLEKLSVGLDQLLSIGEALPTNGAGPQIVAWQFFTNSIRSLPTAREIRDRASQIDPAIFRIESAQGTPYLPDSHLVSDARQAAEWALTNSVAIDALQVRLKRILTNATMEVASVPVTAEPNQPAASSQIKTNQVADAKAEAEKTIAETKTEAGRILEQAKAEAARILEETRAEAMRILMDAREKAEAILAAIKEKQSELEAPRVHEVAKEAAANTAAAKEEGKLPNPMVETEQRSGSEPGAPEFREVIADVKLRKEFLPFTTPGNMRLPGQFRSEKSPVSLRQLKEFGALEPTRIGLERLVEIASTPQDAVRPRWKFRMKKGVWQRKPAEVEQAGTVQQLLIKHGPEFVAAGLLAP